MNNTDPTSFQSILAGVKKLREQNGAKDDAPSPLVKNYTKQNHQTPNISNLNTTQSHTLPRRENEKVINAFNQQKLPRQNIDDSQTKKRPFQGSGPGNTVLVNTTQKENPLLNHLKNTSWRYVKSQGGTKIVYDYLVQERSVLFLTLSYHKLYAEYIGRRMAPIKKEDGGILIFIVDDTNSDEALNEITKVCMFSGFTLLLAFNFEQASKYIEYLNI